MHKALGINLMLPGRLEQMTEMLLHLGQPWFRAKCSPLLPWWEW